MQKPHEPKVLRGRLLHGPAGAFILAVIVVSLAVGAVCTWSAVSWIGKPFPGFLVNTRMALTNVGLYNWTGTQANLSYPDKILAADGKRIARTRDLREAVAAVPIGTPVVYQVERRGETVRIPVSTMRFTLGDFLIAVGSYLAAGLIYLLLGIVVILLKPDSPASRAFLSVCVWLCLNNVTNMDMVTSNLGLTWLYLLSGVFIPAAGVHLALLFPGEQPVVRKRPWVLALPYLVSTVIAVPMELLYPAPIAVRLYNDVGALLWVLAAVTLLGTTLHAFFKGASGLDRQRAKVVLSGVAVAFPLPAVGVLLASLGATVGGQGILSNFFLLPSLFFPAAIGYAIVKHNLFDVDRYIKRAVGYGLMTAIVGSAYAAVQLLFGPATLRPLLGGWAERIYPALFALLVVFFFDPVKRRVQGAVDRLFYRRKYDYRETVTRMSETLATVLDLDEIVERIIRSLREVMFIDTAGLILLQQGRGECRAVMVGESPAGGPPAVREACLQLEDPLVSLVSQERALVTEYDVAESARFASVREAAGRRFAELGVSLALPIVYHDELLGVLALGRKKSGHFYTRDDIGLLETLANHGAVAIQNANLAQQMRKEELVRANLTRYLSPHFVEKVVNEDLQLNLGGDRKVVSVLFSDIRSFTSITESRPPDQLVSVLNEYFTSMAACVFEKQGSIDKYIGDAIMAVFGSLVPLEDAPRHAVESAIEMMRRLPERNEHWAAAYDGFQVKIGIGITTGEVFLGNIGSPERMEYTVIGDTVNVSSRFSGLAAAGQILVDRETLEGLGGVFRYRELPPMSVKGKSERMQVFEILYS